MKTPNKILLIITRRIGDVLLATPLIHSIKAAWPHVELDVLVFASTADALKNNPYISHVICIAEHPSLSEHLGFLRKVWRNYDIALSALPGDKPTLYAWAAGKKRFGLLEDKPNQHWKRLLLNTWLPFDNDNTHTVSMYLSLAAALHIKPIPEVILRWSTKQADQVNHLIDLTTPYAVLHIYPKYTYKMWHEHGWIDLAEWLISQNLQVVLTGSAAEDEMFYIKKIIEKLPATTISLCGKLDLGEIAYLLTHANLYIGPDTSISHIAAAMGTPTIALFGPSNPIKWGPWPKNHPPCDSPYALKGTQTAGNVTLIQGKCDCVPCFGEGCERHINSTSDCLQQLSAQEVIKAAKKLLLIETNAPQ